MQLEYIKGVKHLRFVDAGKLADRLHVTNDARTSAHDRCAFWK